MVVDADRRSADSAPRVGPPRLVQDLGGAADSPLVQRGICGVGCRWLAVRRWLETQRCAGAGWSPPLDSLSIGWPAGREHAEVSYLLSASVVEYLVRSSGERGLERFFAEWRRQESFDGALRTVFGATPGQLEGDWRKWARRRYGWLMIVSHSTVFWAILSTGLVAMVWIRRRYRREQMARLRAGEPPDAPVFWTPPTEG